MTMFAWFANRMLCLLPPAQSATLCSAAIPELVRLSNMREGMHFADVEYSWAFAIGFTLTSL
jgi:hypothetical protein